MCPPAYSRARQLDNVVLLSLGAAQKHRKQQDARNRAKRKEVAKSLLSEFQAFLGN